MFTDYSPFVQLETEGSITTSTSGNPTLLFVDGCPECHGDNSGGFNATIALCSAPV